MQRQKPRQKQPAGTSNVSHISASARHRQDPTSSLELEMKSMKRDFYTQINGIEASVKLIMTALNIPVVEGRNTSDVQRPSSMVLRQSTPKVDNVAPDPSTGENMYPSQRLGGLQQSTFEWVEKPVSFSTEQLLVVLQPYIHIVVIV